VAGLTEISELTLPHGRKVMLVEDEYLLAADLANGLTAMGAEVYGPFATVRDALKHLQSGPAPDFAILDINLRGEMVFPVADHLLAAAIPFVFVTGYDSGVLPAPYSSIPKLEKPLNLW